MDRCGLQPSLRHRADPRWPLGDSLGRRRVFLAGVLGFLASSLMCAAAPSMSVLLLARGTQGVSAGLVVPQTIGLIKAAFRGSARLWA